MRGEGPNASLSSRSSASGVGGASLS